MIHVFLKVRIKGTTPVPVTFDMSAVALGEADFQFTARLPGAKDAFVDGFEVLSTQDPVPLRLSLSLSPSHGKSLHLQYM